MEQIRDCSSAEQLLTSIIDIWKDFFQTSFGKKDSKNGMCCHNNLMKGNFFHLLPFCKQDLLPYNIIHFHIDKLGILQMTIIKNK